MSSAYHNAPEHSVWHLHLGLLRLPLIRYQSQEVRLSWSSVRMLIQTSWRQPIQRWSQTPLTRMSKSAPKPSWRSCLSPRLSGKHCSGTFSIFVHYVFKEKLFLNFNCEINLLTEIKDQKGSSLIYQCFRVTFHQQMADMHQDANHGRIFWVQLLYQNIKFRQMSGEFSKEKLWLIVLIKP